jgi:hypothetical protein
VRRRDERDVCERDQEMKDLAGDTLRHKARKLPRSRGVGLRRPALRNVIGRRSAGALRSKSFSERQRVL